MRSDPVLALNIHAGCVCGHSGACCTTGWPIPVDPGPAARIRADLGLPPDALDAASPMPDGVRVTLSHFCPTAAWMLFRQDVDALAVEDDRPSARPWTMSVAHASRPLDEPLLHAAIRSADLLL